MNKKSYFGDLMLFLAAFIWGTAFVAQIAGMDRIGPFTFNMARSIVAVISLGAYLIFTKAKLPKNNYGGRKMKNKENLNRYLSNLAVLVTKTHNLHWNVVGARFKAIHEYTESLYDYYFEKFDDVAETFKMKGEYPLVKVADYLKHATVKELDAKDFTIPEVVASIKEDMELMLADAKKIREVANEEDDFSVANMMEDHIAYFVKQLWFIQAMSK